MSYPYIKRSGLDDVQRGSLIRWVGIAGTAVNNNSLSFWEQLWPADAFKKAIEKRGFTVVKIEEYYDDSNNHWWFVEAINPKPGSLEGAGSWITQAAWETFGWVSNEYTVDATGLGVAPTPAPAPTPVPLPNTQPNAQPGGNSQANNDDRCANKDGLEWIACKFGFDSTAQQLGLGIGSGVTLSLLAIGLVALVILKR